MVSYQPLKSLELLMAVLFFFCANLSHDYETPALDETERIFRLVLTENHPVHSVALCVPGLTLQPKLVQFMCAVSP